jgi:hypothetical protein
MRKTPETKINFQIGDLFINKNTNIMWYIVDIDIAYLAISYLNLNSPYNPGIEYITKYYVEQFILENRFLYFPVKHEI